MSKLKILFLGPVIVVLLTALLIGALIAGAGVLNSLSLTPGDFLPAGLSGLFEGLFYFSVFALPAIAAGALAAPPEGPGRWTAAFRRGMLGTALFAVPAVGVLVYYLPGYLDRSLGGDGMLIIAALAFLTAAQLMSAFGGVLRYGLHRRLALR
jgi:hypothetical protein